MTKILFKNEEGLLEIIDSDRIYIDPDAPTDILIVVRWDDIRIRIRFSDIENAISFMNVIFECDKINLFEIAEDNPELIITVEPYECVESAPDFMDFNALDEYFSDMEEYGEEDE